MTLILTTRRLFDGKRLHDDRSTAITIRGGRIAEVSVASNQGEARVDARQLDASSLTLLPGLIDAHFHPVSASFDVAAIDRSHPSLRALDARSHLEAALLRGFTTVRDAGESPTDPFWMNQFADEEIRAAVEEAATRRTYVMAHAHTAEAVRRCVRNGVRSIEHGTLMDRESADIVAAAGAFVVPTLAVVDVLRQNVTRLPPGAAEKLGAIADQNAESLAACVAAGAKLGFGTDLFGELRDRQGQEFIARGRVQAPLEVIRSATHVNAELMNLQGQIGTIAPGAFADIIGVAGNPFNDLNVLAEPGRHLKLIIRGGEIVMNRLTELPS